MSEHNADNAQTAREDAFAAYVRTIGRGPGRSRALTRDEARAAMGMILDQTAAPLQVGAFLLVLRYRKESPDELAGFVEAARQRMRPIATPTPPDLDWPSYADRHKQLPWFVLSALLLAQNGVHILMHGLRGHEDGCVTTARALAQLGIMPSASLNEAAQAMARTGFAFALIGDIAPEVDRLFAFRPQLGVRTAANTFCRALNPLRAPAQILGVFHPNYLSTHAQTAMALGQNNLAAFKGGGGEAQTNPDKPCHVVGLRDGIAHEETWPALTPGARTRWRDEPPDPARLGALWRGDIDLQGPTAAIVGTTAIAWKLLGRTHNMAEAREAATDMWKRRNRSSPLVARTG